MKRLLTSILLVLLHLPQCMAQSVQYRVSSLPTQRLLPVANVRCIMQDSEGYMWYGTVGSGVCRDNGYQIDVFRSDSRNPTLLASNTVNCLAEDRRNGIWVGTREGVYRIDKSNYRVEPMLPDELGGRNVETLLCDSRGRMWIAAGNMVVQMDSAGQTVGRFPSQWKGAKADVTCMTEDLDGQIWMGQRRGGLCLFDESKRMFVEQPWDYGYSLAHILAGEHGLWIGTWDGGIVRYDKESGKCTVQTATLGSERKRQIVGFMRDSRQGLYWVTTMDNLYVYQEQDGSLQPFTQLPSISDGNKILDQLAEDRDGNVWVAGFVPNTFIVSPNINQTVRHEVRDMLRLTGYPLLADRVVADGGQYWIWQGRQGLVRYSTMSGAVSDAGGNRYEPCIEKCHDGEGIWVAERGTLLRLTANAAGTKQQTVATLDDKITCIRADKRQNVWVGTKTGLYRLALLGGRMTRMAECQKAVTHIAVGANDTYYYITGGRELRGKDGIIGQPANYTALTMARDGTLWVATAQGDVFFLDGNRLVRHEQASDERGDGVKSLLTDDMGHLWVLSDQHVKEINPQNHAMRLIRSDDHFVCVNYFYQLEPVDGLHICIGGAGAFCILPSSPELNQMGQDCRRPVVTTIETDDTLRMVNHGERRVEVEPTATSLTLRLSTLEHLDADKVTFAYKIEGWNDGWIRLPQGVNTIHLSNLPKGEYTLTVRATDTHGSWGEATDCLVIRILPHWWQTWWARLLFVVALTALLYGLWLLGHRIRQLRALQRKRKEIVLTEIELHPDELEASRIDNEFLQKAVQMVEKNIAESDYSVEQMSSDLCMSRMNLYRRLHSLTGQTPTEFMRDLRLKKAAQLLLSMPEAPINEIASKVGFSTPSYFSKCFKQMFGVLPTQYGSSADK